ncbi:MAG TPA: hypothetical protein VGF29_14750 [Hyphomicrobiaceae bacterium]|jgi:hypothetical protein
MTATHHPSQRETQGAIDFDAALEGYASGYMEPEELLRAAGLVRDSSLPIDEEHARAIARLTGAIVKLADYGDAGRAVQRWFAAKAEAGITRW